MREVRWFTKRFLPEGTDRMCTFCCFDQFAWDDANCDYGLICSPTVRGEEIEIVFQADTPQAIAKLTAMKLGVDDV